MIIGFQVMARGLGRSAVILVGLLTCLVTITSVGWLSRLIAAQHGAVVAVHHGGHRLLDQSTSAATQLHQETTTQRQRKQRKAIAAGVREGLEQRQKSAKEPFKTPGATPAAESIAKLAAQCRALKNTDYWGDPVKWGTQNKLDSAKECCAACQQYKPDRADQPECNVWVYCGDKASCGEHYKECWLKHLVHPEGSSPKTGPDVPWTSGVFGLPEPVDYEALTKGSGEDRSFHVVITAQGPATHWQCRVAYYWYRKIQAQCRAQGVCHMGGFTRLLHSGQADELMKEIPTHVVKPLEDKDNKGYVVLNRPWAFVQWMREATIPEKYILMSEPDHIWLKPMPNLMVGDKPAAFPFFYIEPAKADNLPITEKFTGKLTRAQAESISPIGNAPTLLTQADLKKVVQTWMNVSHAIFDDEEAHKEMYAFTISCFLRGVQPATLHLKMMAQPPWDSEDPYGPGFYLLHYTYGMDYTLEGKFMPGKVGEWRFDKRTYSQLPPPRNLGEPPTGMNNQLVRHLIHAINEATSKIPGWDDFSQTGVAKELWDGKL